MNRLQRKSCPMAATGEGRTADEQDRVHQDKMHLRGKATYQIEGRKHREKVL